MRTRQIPTALGATAAVLWWVVHRLFHRDRGWPMEVLGEWDVLLPAVAIAHGRAPDLTITTLHGHELGSAVIAAIAAAPIAMGIDPVVAGKWVAASFGAASAALVVWLAAWLRREEPRSALVGGLVAMALVVFAWPGLHFELAGLQGRTPEALLPQLAAAALIVCPERVRWGSVGGAGVLLGAGWLLSPVAIWTAAVLATVLAWRLRSEGGSLALLGLGSAAFALPLGLLALAPGGSEAVPAFLGEQLQPLGAGSGRPLGPRVTWLTWRALEGGAHNAELRWRAMVLGVVGLGAALAPLGWIALGWATPARRGGALLAGLALSWWLPLALLPADTWFYPLAYRYWLPLLAIGVALLSAGLAGPRGGRFLAAALLVGALSLAPSVPRSMIAPAPSLTEALTSTGAHRLTGRRGRPPHAAFDALAPFAPAGGLPALAQGYGLAVGADVVTEVLEGRAARRPWLEVPLSDPAARHAFLVGLGCGAASCGAAPAPLLEVVEAAPVEVREPVLFGLALCADANHETDRRRRALVRDLASFLPPRPCPP